MEAGEAAAAGGVAGEGAARGGACTPVGRILLRKWEAAVAAAAAGGPAGSPAAAPSPCPRSLAGVFGASSPQAAIARWERLPEKKQKLFALTRMLKLIDPVLSDCERKLQLIRQGADAARAGGADAGGGGSAGAGDAGGGGYAGAGGGGSADAGNGAVSADGGGGGSAGAGNGAGSADARGGGGDGSVAAAASLPAIVSGVGESTAIHAGGVSAGVSGMKDEGEAGAARGHASPAAAAAAGGGGGGRYLSAEDLRRVLYMAKGISPHVRAPPEYSDPTGADPLCVPGYFFACPDPVMFSRGALFHAHLIRAVPPDVDLDQDPKSAARFRVRFRTTAPAATVFFSINSTQTWKIVGAGDYKRRTAVAWAGPRSIPQFARSSPLNEYRPNDPSYLTGPGRYTIRAYCTSPGFLPSEISVSEIDAPGPVEPASSDTAAPPPAPATKPAAAPAGRFGGLLFAAAQSSSEDEEDDDNDDESAPSSDREADEPTPDGGTPDGATPPPGTE